MNYNTTKHISFFYLLFILNIIFLSIISISLYKLLCRPDLDIFYTRSDDSYLSFSTFYNIQYNSMEMLSSFTGFQTDNFFLTVTKLSFLKSFLFYETKFMNLFYYLDYIGDYFSSVVFSKFNEIVEVKFFTKVNSFTHVDFFCLQDSIFLVSNDTTLIFFRIITPDNQDISCIVVFLISPSSLTPALTKLQCFCFDNLHISSRESIDLPVIFSIDFNLIPFFSKKLNILFFYLLLEK